MKLKLFRIASLATLCVSSGWAQLSNSMTADIPFDFTAGKVTMPAGAYAVTAMGPGVLKITSADSKHSAIVVTIPERKTKVSRESKLMFNRYADQYFLSQVWAAGREDGFSLRPTRAERELAQLKSTNAVVVARKPQ